MKTSSIIATTAALLSAPALAAPAGPAPVSACTVNSVYAIDGFGTRKYDGANISTLFFNIKATNNGTLDFECSPHDEVTGAQVETFESGRSYKCADITSFFFRYTVGGEDERDQLFLWQDVFDDLTIGGAVVAEQPIICHAGPVSTSDTVCSWSQDEQKLIDMKEL